MGVCIYTGIAFGFKLTVKEYNTIYTNSNEPDIDDILEEYLINLNSWTEDDGYIFGINLFNCDDSDEGICIDLDSFSVSGDEVKQLRNLYEKHCIRYGAENKIPKYLFYHAIN